ncbi:MAG TPA: glutamine synthetase type III [Firmicutes bacterium]|mgnify:CR=1 FL=1|nr:glutamine synthetase type III [Bacillota bacterium]
MKAVLPKSTFDEMKDYITKGTPLTLEIANVVANAMKDWAIEKGATHYTHWFQPLTGSTAEKHDSFISPTEDGGVIMEFSGKQLVQGEPDASSFPSGGLRLTFEARGYTAWDPTSPAFIKEDSDGDKTLCIPTAFYSYTGMALDKKVPLLRSMEAVSKQAMRILRAFGNTSSKKVTATMGPEQEYFLIDRKIFLKRLDLMLSGRTLFGAPSPKGQELSDQYFGSIKDRVSAFMTDLDIELWKMGISSKTRHNEVAPAQFEMVPVFTSLNVATDHNQLAMETMQKVAIRHNLVCLLHEKPYAGVNGSGKHNNWSLSTDDGLNLLEPGETPHDNAQFLMFLASLIQSVDKHADLLRGSAATPGNDHRLGANEAPPAIISIFLGSEISEILECIAAGKKIEGKTKEAIKIGVDTLPEFPKDNTDRNRTSPFAFTGNKFEFRMVGSSASIAGPNIVLNTIVAETLDEFATRLEKASDINGEAAKIIKETVTKHMRIIFNGNGYSEEWIAEAEKRGLPNIKNTVDAHKSFATQKAKDLFLKYRVLSHEELNSRYEIYLEQYAKIINIEGMTALRMSKTQYIPAVINFISQLADSAVSAKASGTGANTQKKILKITTELLDSAFEKTATLEKAISEAANAGDTTAIAEAYRDKVFTACASLRKDIDALEEITPKSLWPVPSYADMLFTL